MKGNKDPIGRSDMRLFSPKPMPPASPPFSSWVHEKLIVMRGAMGIMYHTPEYA